MSAMDGREGAFRKRLDVCPHCEYKRDYFKWLTKELMIEIAFIIDHKWGRIINPEETAVVICRCPNPKCDKKNVSHYALRTLLELDFVDHDLIQKEMDKRGLVDGFIPKEEIDEDAMLIKASARMVEAKAMLGLGMMSPARADKEIPDFEVPCGGSKILLDDEGLHIQDKKGHAKREPCTVILTKENCNPDWKTPHHLVIRCPNCGHGKSITEELVKLGYLDEE
jgi:hypothetical protein